MQEERPFIGFVDPGENIQINERLDLNRYIIKHPAATFFVRVHGHSMQKAGIENGDILVIDKSLSSNFGEIALISLDGQFTVRRLHKGIDGIYLYSEGSTFQCTKVPEGADLQIWGVVTYVIHEPARSK